MRACYNGREAARDYQDGRSFGAMPDGRIVYTLGWMLEGRIPSYPGIFRPTHPSAVSSLLYLPDTQNDSGLARGCWSVGGRGGWRLDGGPMEIPTGQRMKWS